MGVARQWSQEKLWYEGEREVLVSLEATGMYQHPLGNMGFDL